VAGLERALPASWYLRPEAFAPLLSRLLADLALHGGTDEDLRPFDPGRAALTAPASEPRYLV
jgi:glycine/D-amino acid oxidase-like deaminating enzyme